MLEDLFLRYCGSAGVSNELRHCVFRFFVLFICFSDLIIDIFDRGRTRVFLRNVLLRSLLLFGWLNVLFLEHNLVWLGLFTVN